MAVNWQELLESASLYEQFPSPGVDYRVVADHLRRMTRALGVLVASYSEERRSIRTEALSAAAPVVKLIRETLGLDPFGRSWPLDDQMYASHLDGRLRALPSLYEMSFRLLPAEACAALEGALGSLQMYDIGLMYQGRLLGVAALAFPAEVRVEEGQVETHVRLLAASMHRKELEADRERSEHRWAMLMCNMRDGVFLAAPDGRYLEVNPAACELLGYTRAELLSLTILDVRSEHGLAEFRALAEQGSYLGEVTLRRKDGSTFPVEINATRLPDGNYLGAVRDLAERKRMEEATARQAALEGRDRARQEFIHIVTHELRNPMTAIKGTLSLLPGLLDEADHPRHTRLLQILRSEVDHLAGLLDEVVAAVNAQETRLPLRISSTDLSAVVSAALATFANGEARDRLEVRLPARGGPVAMGDRKRLEEVVRNLAHNALKYSTGRVTVRLGVSSGAARLSVKDRGIGIPPEELAGVFAGFRRGSNLEGRDPGGLGLGLKICRDLVERHGGRIWAESRLDKGTTVFVELPLAAGRVREPQE